MSGANKDLTGILPVYKPVDWTSFDVVAKLRGILHTRRIGHGGTLDPMATGVLPVFVGKATRCCDIIPDKRKCYRAGFRLGFATDTQDITGSVISRSEKKIDKSELETTVSGFVGEIFQLPPMYSAVKVDGKKLYELARQGREIDRSPRNVMVYSLELEEFDGENGVLSIDCARGTYVRTIIHDIGRELGCGAVMTSLERTRSGGFELSDCRRLEDIAAAVHSGVDISSLLLPTDRAFMDYPECRLWDDRVTQMYRNGVRLRPDQVIAAEQSELYRVYTPGGEFLGLGGFRGGEFRTIKNLK